MAVVGVHSCCLVYIVENMERVDGVVVDSGT